MPQPSPQFDGIGQHVGSLGFVACALFALWLHGGRDELQAYIFLSAFLFVLITLGVTSTIQ
jgi:hypothetical protein